MITAVMAQGSFIRICRVTFVGVCWKELVNKFCYYLAMGKRESIEGISMTGPVNVIALVCPAVDVLLATISVSVSDNSKFCTRISPGVEDALWLTIPINCNGWPVAARLSSSRRRSSECLSCSLRWRLQGSTSALGSPGRRLRTSAWPRGKPCMLW